MTRRLLLLALLLCLAAPATARAVRPALGIADQKPATFADARFRELGVRLARLDLPWDVLQDPATLATVDDWMAGARDAGTAPLLTIDRSRVPGFTAVNPTPEQISAAVRGWRTRWPDQVNTLSAWNEGNINKRPELVAKWWLAVRRACPGCTVLGADLVDRSNAASWTQRFVRAAKRAPTTWGLHAYNDVNRFSTESTQAFLKGAKGKVWLTETGGVLNRSSPRRSFRGCGADHAARATDFLLRTIAPSSSRITRIYLYSWNTTATDRTWDSGLVAPDGAQRPALAVVRRWLGLAPVSLLPAPESAGPVTTTDEDGNEVLPPPAPPPAPLIAGPCRSG